MILDHSITLPFHQLIFLTIPGCSLNNNSFLHRLNGKYEKSYCCFSIRISWRSSETFSVKILYQINQINGKVPLDSSIKFRQLHLLLHHRARSHHPVHSHHQPMFTNNNIRFFNSIYFRFSYSDISFTSIFNIF